MCIVLRCTAEARCMYDPVAAHTIGQWSRLVPSGCSNNTGPWAVVPQKRQSGVGGGAVVRGPCPKRFVQGLQVGVDCR